MVTQERRRGAGRRVLLPAQHRRSAPAGQVPARGHVEPDQGRRERSAFWRVQAADLWAVGLVTVGVLLGLALYGAAAGLGGPRGRRPVWAPWSAGPAYLLPVIVAGGCGVLIAERGRRPDHVEHRSPGASVSASCWGCWHLRPGRAGRHLPTFSETAALREAGAASGALVGRPLQLGLGTAGAVVVLVAVVGGGRPRRPGSPWAPSAGGWPRRVRHRPGRPRRWGAEADSPPVPYRTRPSKAGSRPVGVHRPSPRTCPDRRRSTSRQRHPEPERREARRPSRRSSPIPSRSRRTRRLPPGAAPAPGDWALPPMALLHALQGGSGTTNGSSTQAGEDLVRGAWPRTASRPGWSGAPGRADRHPVRARARAGVKVARVTSLSRDIAYAMASPDVRILAPIPGKSGHRRRGAQPHAPAGRARATSSTPRRPASPRPPTRSRWPMGRDIAGRAVMVNLAEMPHVLISGRHRLREVVVHQLDHHVDPDAQRPRRGPADPDRPQAGRARSVRRVAPPAHPGRRRPQEGRQRAGLGGQGDGTPLRPAGRERVRDITGYNQLVDDGLVAAPPNDRRRIRDTAAKALGEDHPAVDGEDELDEPRARAAPAVHPRGGRRAQRPDDGGRPRRRGLHRAHRPDGPGRRHPPGHRHPAAFGRRDHRASSRPTSRAAWPSRSPPWRTAG